MKFLVEITKVEGRSATEERLTTAATELEVVDNILLECNVCGV